MSSSGTCRENSSRLECQNARESEGWSSLIESALLRSQGLLQVDTLRSRRDGADRLTPTTKSISYAKPAYFDQADRAPSRRSILRRMDSLAGSS